MYRRVFSDAQRARYVEGIPEQRSAFGLDLFCPADFGFAAAGNFRVGQTVEIRGLQSREELNGSRGRLHEYFPADDRWTIYSLESPDPLGRFRTANLLATPVAMPATDVVARLAGPHFEEGLIRYRAHHHSSLKFEAESVFEPLKATARHQTKEQRRRDIECEVRALARTQYHALTGVAQNSYFNDAPPTCIRGPSGKFEYVTVAASGGEQMPSTPPAPEQPQPVSPVGPRPEQEKTELAEPSPPEPEQVESGKAELAEPSPPEPEKVKLTEASPPEPNKAELAEPSPPEPESTVQGSKGQRHSGKGVGVKRTFGKGRGSAVGYTILKETQQRHYRDAVVNIVRSCSSSGADAKQILLDVVTKLRKDDYPDLVVPPTKGPAAKCVCSDLLLNLGAVRKLVEKTQYVGANQQGHPGTG